VHVSVVSATQVVPRLLQLGVNMPQLDPGITPEAAAILLQVRVERPDDVRAVMQMFRALCDDYAVAHVAGHDAFIASQNGIADYGVDEYEGYHPYPNPHGGHAMETIGEHDDIGIDVVVDVDEFDPYANPHGLCQLGRLGFQRRVAYSRVCSIM
jgi:hypothetical protein